MKKSKKIVLIVISCIVVLATIAGVIFGIVMNQVAPVVTEFEKDRAKEIALLKKEKPGYIVSTNNRAERVEYLLLLRDATDTAAKKFVKKYDLKKRFPKAEVEAGYGVVTLEFNRDDYTKAVHYALANLAKKSSVQVGEAHIYPASTINYIPNISLYAENPQKLEFERQNRHTDSWLALLRKDGDSIFDIGRILTTKADYNAYIDLFAAHSFFEEYPEELENVKALFSEEFFESNAMLVTKKVTSGEVRYNTGVNSVYLSGNKIYVVVSNAKSEGIIMVDYPLNDLFYITVSKDAIEGATELITLD